MGDSCTLIDGYAVIVQLLVGIVAISTLLIKRAYEWPQRPWLVWFFDTAKQAFSSALMHLVNVLAAYIVDIKSDDTGPDQCVWYLASILIDGTLLLMIMALLVILMSWFVDHYNIQTLRHGEYEDPPDCEIWAQQLAVYSLFLLAVKGLCLWILYKHPGFYKSLAMLLVKPFVESRRIELIIVVIGIPCSLAILQYWLMDSLLKANWRSIWIRRVTEGWHLVPAESEMDDDDDELRRRYKQNLLRTQGVTHYVLGSVDHFHTDFVSDKS